MVSLFLIFFIVVVITLIVEIAATALKLTGLDIHAARFQALSAITGTGFTTRETESVMRHRQRRRIIMVLMVLGPICFLGIFSSLLISMRQEFSVFHVILLLLLIVLLLLLTRNPRFVSLFHRQVERQLRRYRYPRRVQLEEVLELGGEYGVFELKVTNSSSLAKKPLAETGLKDKGLIVLAIERGGQLQAVPGAQDVLEAEDVLILFGHRKGLVSLAHRDG